MIHIDAEDLAEQDRQVLPVPFRIAAGSGIAHANIEVAVWAKHETAAVVAVGGSLEGDDLLQRLTGIGLQIGGGHSFKERAGKVASLGGVAHDVVFMVLREFRMKDQANQSARSRHGMAIVSRNLVFVSVDPFF